MDKNEKEIFMEKIFFYRFIRNYIKGWEKSFINNRRLFIPYFFFTIAGIPTTVEYFSHLKSSKDDAPIIE